MSVELWAKSALRKATAFPPTVEEHCREVFAAALAIFEGIEADLANALGVGREQLRTVLRPLFLAAAVLHDVGKANSAFQAMVRPKPPKDERQPVRHEILSALFLASTQFL